MGPRDALYVGRAGTGTLNVEAGGRITGSIGYLGSSSASIGTASITGTDPITQAASQWALSNLNVGYSGTGVLNVAAGGRVASFSALLGVGNSGTGTALVTGAGSTWNNNTLMYVGADGTGTLNIQDGGRVNSDYMHLGLNASGIGSALVNGAGSRLTTTRDLNVGTQGLGALNIQAGGLVSSLTGYLGTTSGVGTVTVSGLDSQWTVTNNLYLGGNQTSSGGIGNLTVTGGGALQVGGLLKLWDAGTLIQTCASPTPCRPPITSRPPTSESTRRYVPPASSR